MAVSSLYLGLSYSRKLSDIVFNSDDIGKVISALDPNKAHGHISIRMLKICGQSIHKPLTVFSELH